jgi:hypothetical protein
LSFNKQDDSTTQLAPGSKMSWAKVAKMSTQEKLDRMKSLNKQRSLKEPGLQPPKKVEEEKKDELQPPQVRPSSANSAGSASSARLKALNK